MSSNVFLSSSLEPPKPSMRSTLLFSSEVQERRSLTFDDCCFFSFPRWKQA